jgi:ribonuclease-3
MNNSQGSVEPDPTEAFARRLGIEFSNRELLARALTHRSFVNEHPDEALDDNERLEFLGDAVLDFLVGAWLYNHFPWMREGELTRLRSALVRTEQLAAFARRMDFGPALRLGRGEDHGGGRSSEGLLCATFEAVIGAMFIDKGLDPVFTFIEPLLIESSEHILSFHKDQDAKSIFQERIQALGYPPPTYRLAGHRGPEHQKTFIMELVVDGAVYASGEGLSKAAAAKAAAQAGVERLDRDPLPTRWKDRNAPADRPASEPEAD